MLFMHYHIQPLPKTCDVIIFYRWENQGRALRLRNFPKLTEPTSSRAEVGTQIYYALNHHITLPLCPCL